MVHYARGVAFAVTGRWGEAEAALDSVRRIAAATEEDNRPVIDIAAHALEGEIAARRGQLDVAVSHFTQAMRIEDEMLYFEPPPWYYPVRHSLGAVLLEAGRAAEAEAVYRQDLKRFPENGWSLYGLAESLRAQRRAREAAEVEQRFAAVWSGADVKLTASRF
ncbi:hypothetical protein BH23GEM7_BH23GEM7_40580 [soil metagenome]